MHLVFISNCLFFVLVLAVYGLGDSPPEVAAKTGPSVILIGAGPAGIAGAARLFANNITNVIILEAENRIGGRIQSVSFGNGIVDLGAEWCHGDENNIIYELVKDLNLLDFDAFKNVTYYHSSIKSLDDDLIKELDNLAFELYDEDKDGVKSSLGSYIESKYNAAISKQYGSNKEKITFARDFLTLFETLVLSEEGAFSWSDVAADGTSQESSNINNYKWKGHGYKTILDVLTQKYPDPSKELPVYQSVLFKKDVVKVSYNEGQPSVTCSDTTNYTADHVIWTPSLGVLKHRYQHLFNPTLPKNKVHAVKTLGIAGVAKIFFYFPEIWWPEHVKVFGFIWSDQDKRDVAKQFGHNTQSKEELWLLSLQIFTVNTYDPNVISVWICGDNVPTVEKLDDEAVINGTMFVLHRFLGHQFQNITRPQKIIREKWYTNDHFRGTYSYDTVQSHAINTSQRSVLAEPLKNSNGQPVVLFAGEATNPNHYGTVHGAIETGRREADRIINYYKKI